MSRHAALQDLSRDHHAMLGHAKRLEDATSRDAALAAGRAFLAYYDASLVHHLREEQDHLLDATPDNSLGIQVRSIGQDIEFLVDLMRFSLLDVTTLAWNASRLADTLRRHVRVVEWELFDELQEDVPSARLEEVGKAMTAFRQTVRPTAVGPKATENNFLGTPPAPTADFEVVPQRSPAGSDFEFVPAPRPAPPAPQTPQTPQTPAASGALPAASRAPVATRPPQPFVSPQLDEDAPSAAPDVDARFVAAAQAAAGTAPSPANNHTPRMANPPIRPAPMPATARQGPAAAHGHARMPSAPANATPAPRAPVAQPPRGPGAPPRAPATPTRAPLGQPVPRAPGAPLRDARALPPRAPPTQPRAPGGPPRPGVPPKR